MALHPLKFSLMDRMVSPLLCKLRVAVCAKGCAIFIIECRSKFLESVALNNIPDHQRVLHSPSIIAIDETNESGLTIAG